MKISYTILTHNETDSLIRLLEFVFEHKKEDDEIVVVDDYSKKLTREILYSYSERDDFSRRKTYGNYSFCPKSFIRCSKKD